MADAVVNVALFKFGAGVPEDTNFLPNATIVDHLSSVKKKWEETDPNKHIPECVWRWRRRVAVVAARDGGGA